MQESSRNVPEKINIIELVKKVKGFFLFLKSKALSIILFFLIGGIIGFGFAYLQPSRYISKLTFVLEDGKSTGGLSSLAGQFGFDLGGIGGSSGGIFSGENILLFLKSEGLIRQTLLTDFDANKNFTLADVYAESTGLKRKWRNNSAIGEIVFSKYKNSKLPRREDSLMQILVQKILKTDLSVMKPDKKASFIEVKVSSRNELFSKYFTEKLVEIAITRYIDSKTKTKSLNVAMLKQRADSLASVLNNKTYIAATSQQALVDVNPAIRTAPINSEISAREKSIAATIFSEVVKNLELSKTLLNQETPIIQIVDNSTLPLQKVKPSKVFTGILFASIAAMLAILYHSFKRYFNSSL